MATLASTVGPILIAGLLETYHSWTMNFSFIALCFFVGAVSYITFADTAVLDNIDERKPKGKKAKMSDDYTGSPNKKDQSTDDSETLVSF